MQPKNFIAQLEELATLWWNPYFTESVQSLYRLTEYLATEAFKRRLDYESKEAHIIHYAQKLLGQGFISEEELPIS